MPHHMKQKRTQMKKKLKQQQWSENVCVARAFMKQAIDMEPVNRSAKQ